MIRGFRAACRAGAAVVVSAGLVVGAASSASAMGETPELLKALDATSVAEMAHGATDVLGTTTPVLTTGGYGDNDRPGDVEVEVQDVEAEYEEDRVGDDSVNVLNGVEVEVLSHILSDILSS